MLFDYNVNMARKAAGLAIKAASSAVAKTVNAVPVFINGVYASVAAGDVSLTNYSYVNSNGAVATAAFTLAAGYQCPVTVWANSSGTFAITKGSVLATSASLKSSDFDVSLDNLGYAKIGDIVISNGTASTFTGGTTALDTASLTVTYIDAFTSLGA